MATGGTCPSTRSSRWRVSATPPLTGSSERTGCLALAASRRPLEAAEHGAAVLPVLRSAATYRLHWLLRECAFDFDWIARAWSATTPWLNPRRPPMPLRHLRRTHPDPSANISTRGSSLGASHEGPTGTSWCACELIAFPRVRVGDESEGRRRSTLAGAARRGMADDRQVPTLVHRRGAGLCRAPARERGYGRWRGLGGQPSRRGGWSSLPCSWCRSTSSRQASRVSEGNSQWPLPIARGPRCQRA